MTKSIPMMIIEETILRRIYGSNTNEKGDYGIRSNEELNPTVDVIDSRRIKSYSVESRELNYKQTVTKKRLDKRYKTERDGLENSEGITSKDLRILRIVSYREILWKRQ